MKSADIYSAESVAKRLIASREHFGLSQKDFAKRAGVSPQQMNDWESGRVRLSLQGALKIYETFGLDPNWLFLNKVDTLPHKVATDLSHNPSLK